MGATYTRQSTYADGDTITADHTNDEFDQILAAFAASTGHTHDGTAAEGGPVTKLLGTSITIGNATSGTDITVTFDGESNDGVLKWMEDEDYFEFSDDILIATTEKLQFRDTGLYINSSADGQLDIVADTEIQIAATTVDINGLVDISGNLTVGGNLDVTGTFDLSDSNFTNAGSISLDSISGDADANTSITFSGSDVITIATGGSTAATFNASQALTLSGILDVTDATDASDATGDTGALRTEGGASIAKKLYVGTDLAVSGATTLAATSFGDANITNVGSIALDTIINDGTDVTIDSSGDIILDADGGDVFVKDAGTTFGSLTNSSGNLVIKSGTTTALTFSGANATLAGDLTIGGDDLTMATNTAGALLIADGTNFNPTVVGDLSAITTVASDDVFLAIDTSGGGLKKITRSAIVSGLAAGELSNIVEDTSPQLGGNLDTNSNNILIDDAHFIGDESGNEQLIFQTTGSAVNQFEMTNAASSTAFLQGPILGATGGDSNIDLNLLAKGTGVIAVRGNSSSGAIQLNCESNSHGQIVQGQPHSAGITNTMLLPTGANSTLVSLVSADTLTNKTLTAPKIADGGFIADANGNELVVFQTTGSAVNQLEITNSASGSAPILAATGGDTNIGITLTAKGTGAVTISGDLTVSGTTTTVDTVTMEAANAIVFEGATADAHETTLTIVDPTADRTINLPNQSGTIPVLAAASNTAITSTPAELNILDGVTATATELNLIDGVTATTAELNILDGVTSTAAELNILDGVTTTAAEINLIDGGTARGTTALADGDGILINDAGTMRMTSVETVKTYMSGSSATKGFAIAMAIVFG